MLVNGFLLLGPLCGIGRKLITHLLELVADKFECLVDGIGVSGDGDDAFWARTVTDIDLGSALRIRETVSFQKTLVQLTHCQRKKSYLVSEALDDLTLLSNDAANFLKRKAKKKL